MSTALIYDANPRGVGFRFASEYFPLQVATALAFVSLSLLVFQARRVTLGWHVAANLLQTASRKPTGVPRTARFLLLLTPKSYREGLVGDLEEEFHTIVLPRYGGRLAQLWYWEQVACSLWPLIWDLLKRAAGLTIIWRITK